MAMIVVMFSSILTYFTAFDTCWLLANNVNKLIKKKRKEIQKAIRSYKLSHLRMRFSKCLKSLQKH